MEIKEIKINPIDLNDNVAVGLKLPFVGASNSFFALNYTTLDQIKTNFRNLLLTEKGERFMMPDYGMGLRKFIFDANSGQTWSNIDSHIRSTTSKWMPSITINTIDVFQDERNKNLLSIHIEFQTTLNSSISETMDIDFQLTK